MLKEDRPGSFPITLRFKRGEDPLYDEILQAPDPRQYIKTRLNGAGPPINRVDPLERIADSLDLISELLKNQKLQMTSAAQEQNPKEEPVKPKGTDLSKKFSTVLNRALESGDWT